MIRLRAYTRSAWYRSMLFFVIFFVIMGARLKAQENPEYDELSVFIELPGVGGYEIPVIIQDEEVFIPVAILFDLFKINNVPDPGSGNISGFFIDPDALYFISREKNSIVYQEKTTILNPGDLIRSEYDLYLRSGYFGKIFGLDCYFNFRNLSISVKSNLELPLIREMRQAELRKNLTKLKGELIPDTVINRTYPGFRFGMADWSVLADQNTAGRNNNRASLALGAMVAGGEATASLYYNSFSPFREKDQYYQWRYVDNDFSAVRQVTGGKIVPNATSSLYNPVVGIQVTNTPTTYRRSFGTYTMADRTEPNWIVELYVNNVLVDYVKADASGFFKFDIPLVYGNSVIQLKYYGPWGEEKSKQQNINIPYNFIPEKTFEYKLTAGVVEDSSFSRYSRLSMNYGVSRRMTVGGGFEYLTSVASSPLMPYLNVSWSILNNLLVSGEYTYAVRSQATMTYRTKSNFELLANYIRYVPGQKAIFYHYLEERRASVSIPFRLKNFSAYNRIAANQFVLPSVKYQNGDMIPTTAKYTTIDWMFSGSFRRLSSALTTQAVIIGDNTPNIYSDLSLSLRTVGDFLFIPQIQYSYKNKELISSKMSVEKKIRNKAFFNASVEYNFINEIPLGELGFRYNFRFGQAGMSVRQSRNNTSMFEHARGSLISDSKTGYLKGDNKFHVGRGGISLIPFVDINANGKKDNNEPMAHGLNVKSTTGYVEIGKNDSMIRVLGLEPYTKCYIELDASSFENISWKLPYKILSIVVDPEIVKHIDIPVIVVGEASGIVSVGDKQSSRGIGRIIVNFYSSSGHIAGNTLSEDDGFFAFFGLAPGKYKVSIDTSQLRKLNMASDPLFTEFEINPDLNGDIVEGLDFKLRSIIRDTARTKVITPVRLTKIDTAVMIVHEVVEELVTITKDSWAIQLGAFKNRTNAETLRKQLEKLSGRKVEIVIQDGYFKVRINEIPDRQEVDRIGEVLRTNGITEIWIITLRARQQQVVLREREDSVLQFYESKIFLPFTDDFYKLDRKQAPVIEQTVIERMESHPDLKKVKVREIRPMVRVTPVTQAEIPSPAETLRIIKGKNIIDKVRMPEFIMLAMPVEKTINFETAPPVMKVPEISLQVGVYYKKSEAQKAQRKIMSKLNLPVKIVEQWEYYRVIVTGFHNREETFMYYPELAGLGFPAVKLIEE